MENQDENQEKSVLKLKDDKTEEIVRNCATLVAENLVLLQSGQRDMEQDLQKSKEIKVY